MGGQGFGPDYSANGRAFRASRCGRFCYEDYGALADIAAITNTRGKDRNPPPASLRNPARTPKPLQFSFLANPIRTLCSDRELLPVRKGSANDTEATRLVYRRRLGRMVRAGSHGGPDTRHRCLSSAPPA